GGVSTILEWDADFLTFEQTMAEAQIAKTYQQPSVGNTEQENQIAEK
ncbi:MAG: hypothetical protein JKX85_05860, partial [Phycisphaeraceae bacterium]|nr:hypothetical protein [Phycisphaeraceae bacterium]